MEAAPRLDRRADDHELGAALGRDAGDLLAEAAGPGADDLVPDGDAVRARDRARGLDPLLQAHELPVEVRVDRQLALEDGGATSTIRAPRSAARRQARSSACSVSSRSSSGTTMLR